MGLKATGCYLARTLSYSGAEFQLAEVEMDPVFRYVIDGVFIGWVGQMITPPCLCCGIVPVQARM